MSIYIKVNMVRCMIIENSEDQLAYNLDLSDCDDAIISNDQDLLTGSSPAIFWIRNGINLRRLGRFKEALESFEKAIQLEPSNVYCWINKAVALNQLKKYEEAVVSSNKALALDSCQSKIWIVKGFSLHNLEKYEEASESYAAAIQLDPQGSDGRRSWNNRGAALDNLRRHDDAIECYDEAIMIEADGEMLGSLPCEVDVLPAILKIKHKALIHGNN